jgi:hypothetical protein
LPLAEQAWNRHRHEAPPHDHAVSAFVLAKVLWATGDSASRTRARTLAQESFAAYQQAGPAFTDDATTVESWLAEHPVRQVP